MRRSKGLHIEEMSLWILLLDEPSHKVLPADTSLLWKIHSMMNKDMSCSLMTVLHKKNRPLFAGDD